MPQHNYTRRGGKKKGRKRRKKRRKRRGREREGEEQEEGQRKHTSLSSEPQFLQMGGDYEELGYP